MVVVVVGMVVVGGVMVVGGWEGFVVVGCGGVRCGEGVRCGS